MPFSRWEPQSSAGVRGNKYDVLLRKNKRWLPYTQCTCPPSRGRPHCLRAALCGTLPHPPCLTAMLPSSAEFVISCAHTLPGLPKQVNSCHHDNKGKEKEKLTEVEHPLQRLLDAFPGPNSPAQEGEHSRRGRGRPPPPPPAGDGNQGMIREKLEVLKPEMDVLLTLCRASLSPPVSQGDSQLVARAAMQAWGHLF